MVLSELFQGAVHPIWNFLMFPITCSDFNLTRLLLCGYQLLVPPVQLSSWLQPLPAPLCVLLERLRLFQRLSLDSPLLNSSDSDHDRTGWTMLSMPFQDGKKAKPQSPDQWLNLRDVLQLCSCTSIHKYQIKICHVSSSLTVISVWNP